MPESLGEVSTFVEAAAGQSVVAKFRRQDPSAVQGLRSQPVPSPTGGKRSRERFETLNEVSAEMPEPAAGNRQAQEYFITLRGCRERECSPNVVVLLLEIGKRLLLIRTQEEA